MESERVYGRFAYVYDKLMSQMPYSQWLQFLQDCWNRYGVPNTVVDLGCGTGKLSVPLSELGYTVTGIDLSEDMLAVASKKLDSADLSHQAKMDTRELSHQARMDIAELSHQAKKDTKVLSHSRMDSTARGSVHWLQQDMREWRLPEPVDCVFSFCDCLNYLLEEDDIRRTFRCTYDGLREGGLFIFDVHAPVQLLNYAQEQPFVLDEDEVAYIWTCDYDPDRMQVEHELTFFVAEEIEADQPDLSKQTVMLDQPTRPEHYRRFRERHSQRAYSPQWLSDELRRAGFQVLDRCADFYWIPPDEDSERIFFVARK